MARTIKFRAWDKGKKEWRYSCDLQDHENAIGFFQNLEDDGNIFSEEDAKLFQFTGLLDKNGKECYEGDLVKTYANEVAEVRWQKYTDEYSYYYGYEGLDIERGEIIGNICENPELLK